MAWRPQFSVDIEPAAIGLVLASSLVMALLAGSGPGAGRRPAGAGGGLPRMSASLLLARRNLSQNRVRLVASIGGVALALSLVLALDAIFAGVSNQLTAYIDRAGADVWVGQAGVRNLHMVASSCPRRSWTRWRRSTGSPR